MRALVQPRRRCCSLPHRRRYPMHTFVFKIQNAGVNYNNYLYKYLQTVSIVAARRLVSRFLCTHTYTRAHTHYRAFFRYLEWLNTRYSCIGFSSSCDTESIHIDTNI